MRRCIAFGTRVGAEKKLARRSSGRRVVMVYRAWQHDASRAWQVGIMTGKSFSKDTLAATIAISDPGREPGNRAGDHSCSCWRSGGQDRRPDAALSKSTGGCFCSSTDLLAPTSRKFDCAEKGRRSRSVLAQGANWMGMTRRAGGRVAHTLRRWPRVGGSGSGRGRAGGMGVPVVRCSHGGGRRRQTSAAMHGTYSRWSTPAAGRTRYYTSICR